MDSIKCFLFLFLTYICSFNPGKTRGGNSSHQMVICHLNWRGGEIASTTALNVPDLVWSQKLSKAGPVLYLDGTCLLCSSDLLQDPRPAGTVGLLDYGSVSAWEWLWCCVEPSLRFGNWKTHMLPNRWEYSLEDHDPGKEMLGDSQTTRPSNTQFLLSWESELSCNQAMI